MYARTHFNYSVILILSLNFSFCGQKKVNELSKHVPVIDELNAKLHSLEDTKGWLERRLTEVEVGC